MYESQFLEYRYRIIRNLNLDTRSRSVHTRGAQPIFRLRASNTAADPFHLTKTILTMNHTALQFRTKTALTLYG